MGKSRGERIQQLLKDPNEDTKRFSGSIIFLLIYFLRKATLGNLKKEKKKMWEWLQEENKNFYFDFGEDRDPHKPRNLTLEDALLRYQEFGWVRVEAEDDNEKYILTKNGEAELLDRLDFIRNFIEKIRPCDLCVSESIMNYLQPEGNT